MRRIIALIGNMKLTLDQLSARCPNYREVKALNLDCQGLGTAAEVDKCPLLEFASLRFNSLVDISAFARCRNLWVLDLQQNRLSSLDPLAALPALGTLVLTSNPIGVDKLNPLRAVHILSLEVSGLPPQQVTDLLPSNSHSELWSLNGEYICAAERSGSASARKHVYYSLSKKAQEVVDICNIADDQEREATKFQYLVQDLDASCALQSSMTMCGLDLSKGRGQRFPSFRLEPWLSLPPTSKLSISIFINLYLEGLCGEQVFALVIGALVKDTEASPTILKDLRPHHLLGLALILASDCDGHTLPFDKESLTLLDLSSDFSMAQSRLIPAKQTKMVNRESSPEYSQSHSDRTKALCQVGLKIAEQCNLNYLADPRFQRGKHVQLKTLFSTMRLFAGEDHVVVTASAQRISTRESTAPDRVYDHGRNASLERKPPLVKRLKPKGSASTRQIETEAKGPIQVFSAENGKLPQFMLCTDAQVQSQPHADWRSMQTPPDMYILQTSDSHMSHAELSYQHPSIPIEKEELLSQLSGSSTPIPPRLRDQSPPQEVENRKDGTFLTGVGLNTQQKQVPRSLSTSTLTSRQSVFVSPVSKWRPIASKVLCVVTDQPHVSSYNYYESHKDLLPALPQRKVSRPKLSVIGKQAGSRTKANCGSAEEHLARVYNRDFTPWVPYQLYPRFRARKDQFCVNYGEILVTFTQNMHPRVAIPEETEEVSLIVDSHLPNTSVEAKQPDN